MEKLIIGNLTFEAMPACDFGDYGGSGSVGRANLNVLRDQFKDRLCVEAFSRYDSDGTIKDSRVHQRESDYSGVDLIILEGGYSSESAYIRIPSDDESDDDYRAEYQGIVSNLENYPVLSDDELSQVEVEWCDEAIEEIAKYDLSRELRAYPLPGCDDDTLEAVWDGLDEERQYQLIRDAMDKGNIYAEAEYNGSFIRASEVAPHVADALLAGLSIVRAVKLADGTLVSLSEMEAPYEEPDQYGRTRC